MEYQEASMEYQDASMEYQVTCFEYQETFLGILKTQEAFTEHQKHIGNT